jgi:hypothetical protein
MSSLLVMDYTVLVKCKTIFLTFTFQEIVVESFTEAGITNEQDLVMARTVQRKSQKKPVPEVGKSKLQGKASPWCDLFAMYECLALIKSPWKQRNKYLMEK